jgi:hypothetical protein
MRKELMNPNNNQRRKPSNQRDSRDRKRKDDDLLNDLDDYDDYSSLDDGLSNDYKELNSAQSNLLKSMMDFDARLKGIVSSWLGLVWDEQEEKFKPNPYSKPIMNHHGVSWFVDLFKTYFDKTNTLTSITKKAYKDIMSDVIEVTWSNLRVRKKEFGIKSLGDMHKIGMQIEHGVSLMLLSLRGSGIKGVLRDNYHMNDDGEKPQKENKLINRIGNWFSPKEDF